MPRSTLIVSLALAMLASGETFAQQSSLYTKNELNRIHTQNSAAGFSSQRVMTNAVASAIPQYGFSTVSRGLLSNAIGGRPVQKPFSNYNRGPSVTPYLGLASDTPFTSATTNYYNLVRPQLEQQRMNEKLQQQTMAMQKQLGAVTSQAPYSPTGSENRAPTGHGAVYMNYGGYYTPVPPTSVRGR